MPIMDSTDIKNARRRERAAVNAGLQNIALLSYLFGELPKGTFFILAAKSTDVRYKVDTDRCQYAGFEATGSGERIEPCRIVWPVNPKHA